ncbi:MAG: assimilatory sulfite reductase (NADPH) flavoprotein subunit [Haemophilus sp.]|uniref:assimilatory sulfite reductase (NADPH) flavoprotein subunit n=1 Tax=Haemophilus sp. TaxID=740 RepID=UPI001CB189D1|nr:assimilatory sulfite reductase (NADPH) flavoprotein subunit [Haemophilus sp.]MBF1245798.1 assimilatory sulfite reductase (NADPH) flavoprotein subunit [Haemophilus sp.]MBS7072641.1 assimilatory sulfite reductase (NADPH) flavoprotein subunit [Haemophilus parainfluenzae]
MQHNNPLPTEILNLLPTLTPLQLAWLSGYAWSQASSVEQQVAGQHLAANLTALSAEPFSITVLSGSQTGNAKSVADKVAAELTEAGIAVKRVPLKDYKAKTIADEKYLLLVTSTQGEGEPPEEGVVLHKLLNGKKAPKLTELQFAVLGLGDSSYPNFCQAGKDFDQRFAELGATRLFERVDADLDYSATAEQWIRDIVAIVKEKVAQASPVVQSIATATTAPVAKESQYNKANPFPATLITNQKITGRQSDKDVRHLEFDLAGSDLHYQAGDALGVWFDNDPKLVDEVLSLAQIDPTTEVTIEGKTQTISTALLSHLELTQNTPAFVKDYAALAYNEQLNDLVADNQALQELVQRTPIVDVLHKFPAKLTAEQLVSLLRPLTPRLYSISSSPAEVGEEVHLTVGVVRFEHEGRARSGAASSFLADRVEEDGAVRVFVEHNDNFRLPNDTTKPIIMVGSGTGVAPFRAFMQQRVADEASGKNWLIFGNPHFASDFLYQTEWQQFAKEGFLHKYDFAWSRDQEKKIYVQDKIRENSTALWQWLQEGAYFYVCGDAAKMAKDVEQALLEVIAKEGNLSPDEAEDYLNELREEKRYQRDVY